MRTSSYSIGSLELQLLSSASTTVTRNKLLRIDANHLELNRNERPSLVDAVLRAPLLRIYAYP
jgi:hypothetical protein